MGKYFTIEKFLATWYHHSDTGWFKYDFLFLLVVDYSQPEPFLYEVRLIPLELL